jgi:hypothetical protein
MYSENRQKVKNLNGGGEVKMQAEPAGSEQAITGVKATLIPVHCAIPCPAEARR